MIKAAKQKEKWDIVLEWCNLIKSEDLSDEPVLVDGKMGKSKKEQWFFAKVKRVATLNISTRLKSFIQLIPLTPYVLSILHGEIGGYGVMHFFLLNAYHVWQSP